MPEAMTSWKEIASYFGKGVRTVQRWERCHGLPVRRHSQTSTGPIFAFAEEMEIWVRAKTKPREVPGADESELDRLRGENQALRERIKAYEQGVEAALQAVGRDQQAASLQSQCVIPVSEGGPGEMAV